MFRLQAQFPIIPAKLCLAGCLWARYLDLRTFLFSGKKGFLEAIFGKKICLRIIKKILDQKRCDFACPTHFVRRYQRQRREHERGGLVRGSDSPLVTVLTLRPVVCSRRQPGLRYKTFGGWCVETEAKSPSIIFQRTGEQWHFERIRRKTTGQCGQPLTS